eukprot:g18544.t1
MRKSGRTGTTSNSSSPVLKPTHSPERTQSVTVGGAASSSSSRRNSESRSPTGGNDTTGSFTILDEQSWSEYAFHRGQEYLTLLATYHLVPSYSIAPFYIPPFLDSLFEKWRKLTLQNKKSIILVAFLASVSLRQKKLAGCCVCGYFFSAVPASATFEHAFYQWFHKVYFPKIVFRFHELYKLHQSVVKAGVGGSSTSAPTTVQQVTQAAGTSAMKLLKNLLHVQESGKLPTVTFVYEEVVSKYENSVTDMVFGKLGVKEKGKFKMQFVGFLNRWTEATGGAVYQDEALEQLVRDCVAAGG